MQRVYVIIQFNLLMLSFAINLFSLIAFEPKSVICCAFQVLHYSFDSFPVSCCRVLEIPACSIDCKRYIGPCNYRSTSGFQLLRDMALIDILRFSRTIQWVQFLIWICRDGYWIGLFHSESLQEVSETTVPASKRLLQPI